MTGPSPDADWREALDTRERSLREAVQAIAVLRRSLEGGALQTRSPASASREIAAPSHGATPLALRN